MARNNNNPALMQIHDEESVDSSSDSSSTSNIESEQFDEENSSTTESTNNNQMGTGGNNNDKGTNQSDYAEMQGIIQTETHRVNCLRVILLLSILAIGTAVSSLTYVVLDSELNQDAKDAFVLFANGLGDSFHFTVSGFFESSRSLSQSITQEIMDKTDQIPFITIPHFEAKASSTRRQTKFEVITYAPIVTSLQKEQYLSFTNNTRNWLDESKIIYDELEPGQNRSLEPEAPPLPATFFKINKDGKFEPDDVPTDDDDQSSIMVSSLHVSPPPQLKTPINQNLNFWSSLDYKEVTLASLALKDAVFSSFDKSYDEYAKQVLGNHGLLEDYIHPHSFAVQPIFESLRASSTSARSGHQLVGFLYSHIDWENYLQYLLPDGVNGVIVVLRNSCGQHYTYQLDGRKATYISDKDDHDTTYDKYRKTFDFADLYFEPELASTQEGHCQVFLDVYPSKVFTEPYDSNLPTIFTIMVACLFAFMAFIFCIYDTFVGARNTKILNAAARTNAIVSSLFPAAVRDRLMAEREEADKQQKSLRNFLTSDSGEIKSTDFNSLKTKPLADLYPEVTILFADIVGFTAWSSVREPCQVFQLLESIYAAFDKIAQRRRVFKVETIGDCYVAVCGLPEPRKDHAVVMCRFANDCMKATWRLTKELEASLGPDTGDLTMRMGLHSGPVTAGVLRGERARFQLFGDTMNTAARIESTGMKSKIHLSPETANLLTEAGKSNWVVPREDTVYAKGKGEMKTFWLEVTRGSDAQSVRSGSSRNSEEDQNVEDALKLQENSTLNAKNLRLVEWGRDMMLRLLQQIVYRRQAISKVRSSLDQPNESLIKLKAGERVIDEVAEIVTLPSYSHQEHSALRQNPESVELDNAVVEQLHDFVSKIAMGYRDNPFHNFEHASHVTMSVVKLLSRIVAPSDIDFGEGRAINASTLHDHTYGITSDPLTQFACVFSALIHDLDHPGIPNVQMVKEESPLAAKYKNQSIAEQNSVDLAWALLMQDKYADLRRTIYADEIEMRRFRQLVVNITLATDICDKQLKELRNARWNKAFSGNLEGEDESITKNRKATIVMEHLIQASDVAHTMQHWHIYRKWNERFFMECYFAYKMGRAEMDPAESWFKGEIGFFDFYIIPLAKKLKECGVFGVSSHEYLDYAVKNRKEWESRGEEIVAEMIEKTQAAWKERENSQKETEATDI